MKKSKEMTPFEKYYRRYQRIYNTIAVISFACVIAIWLMTGWFFGVVALLFVFWSFSWYDEGASQNCVDEYEYAYPEDGFRLMFKSWPWFVLMAGIAYFFCRNMPWLFGRPF
ncbi:MAG: hypothetical protein IJ689_03205 [Alphaproteobacteria bacterium]|nr:hypothetical protein [Alphaproteobacteria bacterium]